MGKKNKKSFYKKQLRPFINDNRLLLAALVGAAAGITIANVLGTEKAQQILHTVEDSVSNFGQRIANSAKESFGKNEDRQRMEQSVEA